MMINSTADADAVFLPEWFTPSERDVICAWARQNHRHGGNERFRQLIEHSAPLYVAARTKLEKTQVIASVVEQVRRESPGGGFVKRDFHTGLWFEIGDDKARDKVGHAIRRAVEEQGKISKKKGSSSKSKQAIKLHAKDPEDSDNESQESSTAPNKQKGKSTTKQQANKKQRKSLDTKLNSPQLNNRSLQDSLVVPPFLYQTQGQHLDSSSQARAGVVGPNRTHSMQSSMVVQPGSNLLTRDGPPAFDLFTRSSTQQDRVVGTTEDMFSSTLSNQFNKAAASSQQAFSLMNHQFNAAPTTSGGYSHNQLQMAGRFSQFGTANELNQMGDNAAFLQSNHQMVSNSNFFAGLSNQINNSMDNNSRQPFGSFSHQQGAAGHNAGAGLLAASTAAAASASSMHPMLGNDFMNEPGASAFFASTFGGGAANGMAARGSDAGDHSLYSPNGVGSHHNHL